MRKKEENLNTASGLRIAMILLGICRHTCAVVILKPRQSTFQRQFN